MHGKIIGYRKSGAPIYQVRGAAPDHIPTLAELRDQHDDPGDLLDAIEETRQQHLAAMAELDQRVGNRVMRADEKKAFNAHSDAFDELDAFYREQRRENVKRSRSKSGGRKVESDRDRPTENPTRAQARRTLDLLHRSGALPDHAATKAENLLGQGTTGEQNMAARWVVAAGSEAYRSAFFKMLSDPERGHLLWNAEEQEAYRQVAHVQAEMRIMGETSGGTGGFMVPVVLDPAIMLTSNGSQNPLRRVCRVVQTVGSQWKGLTSAGVTAEWLSADSTLNRAMADASPTVAEVNIPVYLGDAYIPYSYEVGQDAVDFQNQLVDLMTDAADVLQSTAYTLGTGTGQPKGLITALVAAATPLVAPTTADQFLAADPFKVQNALPPRFQARAQWFAALAIINLARQFETAAGALKFPEMANGQLLNRPLNEVSDMDATVDAAATNYILAYGDPNQFVIVDRIGSTVEFIPNLMDQATGRPSGRRGLVLWFRTGSDVAVPNAFRLLNS